MELHAVSENLSVDRESAQGLTHRRVYLSLMSVHKFSSGERDPKIGHVS